VYIYVVDDIYRACQRSAFIDAVEEE